MPQYQVENTVGFSRNSVIHLNNAVIVAIVPISKDFNGNPINIEQEYIIEYPAPYGWYPNSMRATEFGLNMNQTYLFVKESELSS